MSELVTTAATVLVPFLGAGAGAVAAGTAEEAGADLYRNARSLLARLGRLGGKDVSAVAAALEDAVQSGRVEPAELSRLVELAQAQAQPQSQVNVDSVKAKNVFMGPTKIKKFKA